LKSVQLSVRTCAILIFRQFCSDCFVELLLNVHFAFILERDWIAHAVVQKTNLMYVSNAVDYAKINDVLLTIVQLN